MEFVHAGGAAATLVTPPNGSLDGVAQRIVQVVADYYDVELAVVAGVGAAQQLSTPHVIALGCLADNPFIEALYFRWQTLVDRWYPGRGGWVVQVIGSPFRHGEDVLLLGGSDREGVGAAADQLIEQLDRADGGAIPWRLQVQLGAGHLPLPADRIDCLGTAASPVLTPESALPTTPYQSGYTGGSPQDHLLRLGMYGPHADNFHLSRSSQFGLRYLYTGRVEDGERYREVLLEEVRSGALAQLYHYKSLRMFQLWHLSADSPLFDTEEKGEISLAIRTYLLEGSGVANIDAIRQAATEEGIFSRHEACDALNLWAGADWLWRQTGDDQWLTDRGVADMYFEAQVGTDVPLTGLTEGYATYLDVYLEWMLLSCPQRIVDDAHIQLWARRVIGLCTNTGQLVVGPQTDESRYPYNLLRKLAYLLVDGRYLFVADLRERQLVRGMDRVMQFSAGQSFAGDVAACEPVDAHGWICYPLNERLRRWKAPGIEAASGFDRAVARGGWSVEDDYLAVIGVRSGAKSLPNVGSLAAYERFGQRLITADAVPLFPSCASPWRHSSVSVNINGRGAGMADGAEVLAQRETSGGWMFCFLVEMPGAYSWMRTLYWKASAYVLVIDRVHVPAQEPFTLGVNWRCAGPLEGVEAGLATLALDPHAGVGEGRFFVQVSEQLCLQSESSKYPVLGAPPGTPSTDEVMLHATVDHVGGGEGIEVATLLHAVTGTAEPCYRLSADDEGWVVECAREKFHFDKGVDDTELTVDGPRQEARGPAEQLSSLSTVWELGLSAPVSVWAQSEDGARLAFGSDRGEVVVVDTTGRVAWQAVCADAVTALSFFARDLIVGTESGQVCRVDGRGEVSWRHQCQFRVERPFWPWWFLQTPVVGAVAAGRDPESHRGLVAVGTGSTSLNFLDAQTGDLFADVLSPYGLPDRIRAHVSTESSQLQFLVGHSWLTCGSTVRSWTPVRSRKPLPEIEEGTCFQRSVVAMGRSTDGWDSCGVVDFYVGSLANGLTDQLVLLRHGAVAQITLYDLATGDPVWDEGLGGAPVALSVVPGDSVSSARCYVAEQFGWLVSYDGAGKRVLAAHVARSLSGLHANTNVVMVWNREQLFVLHEGSMEEHPLEGAEPLGWYDNPERPGLLCVHDSRLVLMASPAP